MPNDADVELGIPLYLRPSEVGRLCFMSPRRMRRMLAAVGILEKIGGQYVVAAPRLRLRLPGVYDRVYEHYLGQRTGGDERFADVSDATETERK